VDILWLAFLSSTGVYEIVPGFICSLVVAVVVSLMDKEPDKKITGVFDRVASGEDF
jgi:sodium/proline symporter